MPSKILALLAASGLEWASATKVSDCRRDGSATEPQLAQIELKCHQRKHKRLTSLKIKQSHIGALKNVAVKKLAGSRWKKM
jgi:hypothetical protein